MSAITQADKPDEPVSTGNRFKAALSRAAVIDAVARVVARQGPAGVRWSSIEREAGSSNVRRVSSWYPDMRSLVDECYSRAAQGLEESLLCGETTPGTGLDKLAAFLVAVLETRRERGSLLSFRGCSEITPTQRKRLRERDMMIRTRLKRLLLKGQQDGSLAQRNLDNACEMILACVQAPITTTRGAEQRIWDGELVEMLLAALAEPHPGRAFPARQYAKASR